MLEETIRSSDQLGYDHVLYKGEIYQYYDEGLTRRVYVNSDKTRVIKVLISDDSINYNGEEYDIYINSSNKGDMVHTEISEDGMIVEQEYVTPLKWYDGKLGFRDIKFAMSCRNEVGINKDGKVLCFDLSEYKKY